MWYRRLEDAGRKGVTKQKKAGFSGSKTLVDEQCIDGSAIFSVTEEVRAVSREKLEKAWVEG